MKSTILFALFLLSAFFTSYLPSATAQDVLDTDGNLLRNGGTYFILSVFRPGGGVEFAATGNETCPLTVVNPLFGRGFPTILSSQLRIPIIGLGQLFSIQFSIVPWCATTPSRWTIVQGLPESPAVKLTGYQNTVFGEFKIEKASPFHNDYTLLFCPVDESKCGHIGISFDDNGKRRLVVSEDNPFRVQFQKFGSVPDEAPLALKNHVLSGSE